MSVHVLHTAQRLFFKAFYRYTCDSIELLLF